MLTKDQQGYLNTVFEDKITHISPFDPATQTTAGEVITEIKSVFPSVEIFYTGSSKLGIAGENDIDLLIISTTSLEECFKYMKDKYGERFYRMWKYFLLASAGAFRARQNQLWQIALSKNGVKGGYKSVR